MTKSYFAVDLLNNRFPALHGLRAVCGLIILTYHILKEVWPEMARGWFVMDMFFVLSGFLIGLIAMTSLENSRVSILTFYIRRAARTFPSYYIILTIATLAYFLSGSNTSLVWREYLYLTNYYAVKEGFYVMIWGWSLCVEEHFYLACPFILLLLKRINSQRIRFGVIGAVIVGCLMIRLSMVWGVTSDPKDKIFWKMFFGTHTRIDQLFWGILAAQCFYFFPKKTEAFFNHSVVKWALPLCAAIALYSLSFATPKAYISTAFAFTFSAITFTGIILYLVTVNNWITKLLSARIYLYIATLLYHVYLIHLYVLNIFTRPFLSYFGNRWANYATVIDAVPAIIITVALSFSLSYVIHLLVDKPALWLRDRWTQS